MPGAVTKFNFNCIHPSGVTMRTNIGHQYGETTRSAVVLICITAALALSGCGAKYAADEEMQALCAKDGGMKIYETVTLPAKEFSQWGRPLDRYWSGQTDPEKRLGPDYRYVERSEFLRRGDTLVGEVQMFRSIEKIYRRSDGKLLGEAVSYSRSGGDAFINRILSGHPSSSTCPDPRAHLLISVFIKGA
jgi:hypothetical protein